jgi:hypothetical protein
MKWYTIEKNYCVVSEKGHKAIKITLYPSGFEWYLFMPDRPALQTKNPDLVFQTLKQLKAYVSNYLG